MPRIHVHVTGVVQGVGFRPFVWQMATSRGLTGWVRNAADGVHVEAKGPQEQLDSFVLALSTQAPAAARVDTVQVSKMPDEHLAPMAPAGTSVTTGEVRVSGLAHESTFRIVESDASTDRTTLVSPDIATCPACLAEMRDPKNRRYHYPFINCTNCGPRFTIIDALPYDRANTSMAGFRMCGSCAREYADPADRRFHAQPDACFRCGPHLSWRTTEEPGRVAWGRSREESDAIVAEAAQMLLGGGIVAVKGLGGFHLACDASNEDAVRLLRERKMRPSKPLAVMFADIGDVRACCEVDARERALLTGSVRPIVLLRRRADAGAAELPAGSRVAPSVAGTLPELGVMLPYTPLQHLLLAQVGHPLVMTSGNLSDEPIICDDQVMVARMMCVADAFLGNDRPIRARYDDSVVRVADGEVQCVRRARGLAPLPVRMPAPAPGAAQGASEAPEVLACGPEQKATFAVTRGEDVFVSQHVGDLENAEAFDVWQADVEQYRSLFGLSWGALACDMHPEYLSSKWARAQAQANGLPLVEVQHHHAHIASVLGENGEYGHVVGVALDGTGYGADGAIWGGEVLVCDRAACRRAAHIANFRLPGGAAAIRKPVRGALGLLDALGLADTPRARELSERLGVEGPLVRQMLARNLNCPLTSSAGRLFDAMAAICGLVEEAGYDGEPACLLEAAAQRAADEGRELPEGWQMELRPRAEGGADPDDGSFVMDPAPLVKSALANLAVGVGAPVVARRFHEAFAQGVARAAAAVAATAGLDTVALSGGVFMNRLVLAGVRTRLESAGLRVLLPRELPANDGCIAYGQAVVARARLARGTTLPE